MKRIGSRLKILREEKGLSQEGLSDLVYATTGKNIARQTIGSWENETCNPTTDNLLLLSRALDVPVAIFTDDEIPITESHLRVASPEYQFFKGFYMIHVLERETGVDTGEVIPCPRSMFKEYDVLRQPYAIYSKNDSLKSVHIKDGDKIVVNPAEEIPQGTVALVEYHGMKTLRYVYKLKNGDVVLRCDDKDTVLSPVEQEESEFAILGTVVGSFRDRPPARPF